MRRPRTALRRRICAVLTTLTLAQVLAVVPPTHGGASTAPDVLAEGRGLILSTVLGVRELPAVTSSGRGGRRSTAVWGWPLVGVPPVVTFFDLPEQRWLPGHRGIDLAGVAGEEVLAVDAGVVTFSGTVAGVGVLSVNHEGGLRSTYQPVEDRAARGERVRRGQRIGMLGATASHCVLRDCLHLGALRGRDAYVDPLPLLLGAELTLLPITP